MWNWKCNRTSIVSLAYQQTNKHKLYWYYIKNLLNWICWTTQTITNIQNAARKTAIQVHNMYSVFSNLKICFFAFNFFRVVSPCKSVYLPPHQLFLRYHYLNNKAIVNNLVTFHDFASIFTLFHSVHFPAKQLPRHFIQIGTNLSMCRDFAWFL